MLLKVRHEDTVANKIMIWMGAYTATHLHLSFRSLLADSLVATALLLLPITTVTAPFITVIVAR